MTDERYDLPKGWEWTTLGEICQLNPPKPTKDYLPPETLVSFVPMDAVDASLGAITKQDVREYGQVRSGYTYFQENDVIFAKITPCMENGKSAIARGLTNLIGFGSTEFHVLRPQEGISSELIHKFIRQKNFRVTAEAEMTGTAGQARVPKEFMSSASIPLAPREEQDRIVEKIERLFGKIEAGQTQLEKLPRLLKQFRQTVLAAACSGRLVPQDPNHEPASELLKRIQAERRARWEAELRAKGKDPSKQNYPDLQPIATTDLPELPEGWAWASLGELSSFITSGSRGWAQYYSDQGALFVRAQNIGSDKLVFDDIAFVTPPTGSEGERTRLQNNDLLIVITGATTGRSGRFLGMEEAYVNQHVALVRLVMENLAPYLELALKDTASSQGYIQEVSYGLKKGLNLTQVAACPIPLPPLVEQKRIMEKVRLLLSVISVYWEKSQLLMSESEQLKQTILSKAFRGELVEQCPTDEPASVLLQRIRAEKAQATDKKEKKSSRPKQKEYLPV